CVVRVSACRPRSSGSRHSSASERRRGEAPTCGYYDYASRAASERHVDGHPEASALVLDVVVVDAAVSVERGRQLAGLRDEVLVEQIVDPRVDGELRRRMP